MNLHGQFINLQGKIVDITITTPEEGADIEVGENGVFFEGEEAATITSGVNDTLDHVQASGATIRLLSNRYIPGLYASDAAQTTATIKEDGEVIFTGHLEPYTYTQGFAEALDSIELNCIDLLSALEYRKYNNAGVTADYDVCKATAKSRTIADIIGAMLPEGAKVWYDGSLSLSQDEEPAQLFVNTKVSEVLFYGDDEDSVWTFKDVLTEIMRYFNLHITQIGDEFYIFSWDTLRQSGDITWLSIFGDGQTKITPRAVVALSAANVSGTDTTLSIGEVYNKIRLSCEVESVDNAIDSPLDESQITSPYTARQKYLTEYASDGEGITAWKAFYDITHSDEKYPTTYDAAVVTDWYIQVLNPKHWIFPIEGDSSNTYLEKYCADGKNQHEYPHQLMAGTIGAGLFALGKVETQMEQKDDSPTARVDMTNCLIVSVRGTANAQSADREETADILSRELRRSCPVAVYNGPAGGAVLSPADDETTNYIVFSGSIVLNPATGVSVNWNYRDTAHRDDPPGKWPTVPSRNNKDGRYYTQRAWVGADPAGTLTTPTIAYPTIQPFTDKGAQLFEYKYSQIGDRTDKISKVAVLACMLIIGDKCAVETESASGSVIEWKSYKPLSECADEDEYFAQSFTLGMNPKIGDYIIGQEYQMQNTVDFTMGIDAEGTAIPVKRSDKLSGPVKFMILGPVNSIWNDITRRHPTWFRHTKWTTNDRPILTRVSDIILKQFEVKVYSDNGLVNTLEDNDLIYTSDTDETFSNPKDDITFRLTSSLTRAECIRLGVSNSIMLSSPVDATTGNGITSIYSTRTGETAKAEQLYVDAVYREFHRPRLIWQQTFKGAVNRFDSYTHPAISDKIFMVQSVDRDLQSGETTLTLKDSSDD